MHCVVVLCAENCPLHVAVSNSSVISNRYIVVYNKNATDDAVAMHQASVMAALRKRNLEVRGKEGKTLSGEMDAFSMSGWRGMSLEAEDAMIFFFFSFWRLRVRRRFVCRSFAFWRKGRPGREGIRLM
jgi:hypothetical protein